jgi:hypothetical protein
MSKFFRAMDGRYYPTADIEWIEPGDPHVFRVAVKSQAQCVEARKWELHEFINGDDHASAD